MEKLKVRVTLIIVFILLTIITAFTLFYNMYIQQFFSDINHDIFIHQIESYSDQINIKIEEERKELQRKVNDYLNQNKTTEEIMSVDELKNNYQIIIYQEENILPSVKNNFLLESYFIGYEKNIFTNYSSNESIIIYPIETNDETILFIHPVFEFIEEITKQNSYNGSYFIVTSEMDTVYQKEYSSLGFDEYIGKPRYSFTQNEEHYEKDSVDGKSSYVYFDTIDNSLETDRIYYLVVVYLTKTLKSSYKSVTIFSIVYALFAIGCAILCAWGGYKVIEHRTEDFLRTSFTYRRNKKIIIKITKNGKICRKNYVANQTILGMKKAKYLENILVYQPIEQVMEKIHDQDTFEITVKDHDKEDIVLLCTVYAQLKNYILICQNVTEESHESQRIKAIAWYNSVTNLPNLNKLKEDLDNALTKIKDEHQGSIIIVDIKKFRAINRVFGRNNGDLILQKVAEQLATLRDEHIDLYHMDTDIFVLLLHDYTKIEEATQKSLQDIRNIFKQPFEVRGNLLSIQIKLGVCYLEKSAMMNSEVAIKNAKNALKSVKGSRNTDVAIYDVKVGLATSQDTLIESDLIKGIQNEEFIMYYQPQYSLITKKIVGFEALIRWNNPKYIKISPETYIKVAEQNNMIIEIGNLAFHMIFKKMKELEGMNITMSINVSPVQLLQEGFVHQFISLIEQYKINPKMLAVEITETFLMESFDEVIHKLRQLKDYGISIHLDDFGTGYSSMLYLKELPIDAIKIDKEFTKYIMNDKYSKAIVSKIISLTKTLELLVIVEGVETEKQSEMLSKFGCDVIQGYLIGKPMDEEEMLKVIDKYNHPNKAKE